MLIPDAATEAFRRRAAMQCSQRSHRAVADVASWVATGFSGVPESFDELVGGHDYCSRYERIQGCEGPIVFRFPPSVWDIAQRYNKGGPTVTEALYEALKELEAQVIALQRSEGKGLLSRLS
ncbi:Uncharacterised protein [Mycobacterium tuberculosis]|nr:Uncharacterised protein [Mycobacterium tuberculosis]